MAQFPNEGHTTFSCLPEGERVNSCCEQSLLSLFSSVNSSPGEKEVDLIVSLENKGISSLCQCLSIPQSRVLSLTLHVAPTHLAKCQELILHLDKCQT